MTGAACSHGNGISTIRSWSPATIATAETSSTSGDLSATRAAAPGEAFDVHEARGPAFLHRDRRPRAPRSPERRRRGAGTTGAVIVRSTPSIAVDPSDDLARECRADRDRARAARTSQAPTTATAARTPGHVLELDDDVLDLARTNPQVDERVHAGRLGPRTGAGQGRGARPQDVGGSRPPGTARRAPRRPPRVRRRSTGRRRAARTVHAAGRSTGRLAGPRARTSPFRSRAGAPSGSGRRPAVPASTTVSAEVSSVSSSAIWTTGWSGSPCSTYQVRSRAASHIDSLALPSRSSPRSSSGLRASGAARSTQDSSSSCSVSLRASSAPTSAASARLLNRIEE